MSLTAKPRTPSHYRKRQGAHHRHSKSYVKTYWPYLPMIAIIIGGVFLNSSLYKPEGILGWQTNFTSVSLLTLTNNDRAKDKEKGLNLNSQLEEAAQAKANDMVRSNYWSHTSPSGKTAQDFIVDSGYQFSLAGENLAYGFNTAGSVNSAWMASSDHRANILDANYSDVGFGVAEAPNFLGQGPKVIVVAEYGKPSSTGILGLVNQPPTQNVSSLNRLTGSNATWIELALTIIITASVVILLLKHGLGFKKLIFESEEYIIKHPFIDITMVMVATSAIILSHSAGLIG